MNLKELKFYALNIYDLKITRLKQNNSFYIRFYLKSALKKDFFVYELKIEFKTNFISNPDQ